MFNIAEQCGRVGALVIEAQLAGFQAFGVFLDGGLAWTERGVDAFRGALAAGTVTARQLLSLPRGSAQ